MIDLHPFVAFCLGVGVGAMATVVWALVRLEWMKRR
jgi:hypothetical protein